MEKILSSEEYKALAKELLKMKEEDLKMRAEFRSSRVFDNSIDIKNTKRLKEILFQYGWPTISKVGEEAYRAAWLFAVHADLDVPFQEECLQILREQVEGDVRKRDIAQLEDRVRINTGRLQLYGTQYRREENGRLVMSETEDVEHLAERRKEVGLPTSEDEIALMNGDKK